MTLPNTIAELFRNGAAPDAEDVVNLKDIGSFAATVLARYAERPRSDVGAQSESMLDGLATSRGSLSGAADWLDGLALGGLLDDSFWQGLSGTSVGRFGYGDMEAERGFLQLMEEEGLTPAEAEAEMPQRRKGRTGLVGRRGAATTVRTAASRRPGAAKGAPEGDAARGFVMSSGDRMVAETLRSLIAGGLPVVDQVMARVGEPGGQRRPATRTFSLDGMTVDDRLPALSASLAEASATRVAPSRMGIAEPAQLDVANQNAYAFFDAAESVFLGFDEGLAGLQAAEGPSATAGALEAPSLRDRTMFPTTRVAAPRPVQLASVASQRNERRAMVAPRAVAQRATTPQIGARIGQNRSAFVPPSLNALGASPNTRSAGVPAASTGPALGQQPLGRFAEGLVHRPDGAVVPRVSRSLVGGVEARLASAGSAGPKKAGARSTPLGVGFTGYESFAVQQIIERALSVEQTVLPAFDPMTFGGGAAARPPIGAAGRAESRDAAMGAWVNSAVDGAVWLSMDAGEQAAPTNSDLGSRATRAMGLAAVPERRNSVQAPAAVAAKALLASSALADRNFSRTSGTATRPATGMSPAERLSAAAGMSPAERLSAAADMSPAERLSAAEPISPAPGTSLAPRISIERLLRAGAMVAPPAAAAQVPAERGSAAPSLGFAFTALESIAHAALGGQGAANPTRGLALGADSRPVMSARAAAAGPLGRAGAHLGVLRNAMLRPVPTAREALLAQGSAAPAADRGGFETLSRFSQLGAAGIGSIGELGFDQRSSGQDAIAALGQRVAPKLGNDGARGSVGLDLSAFGASSVYEPVFGGRTGAMREMLMKSGWSQPELGLLMQDSSPTTQTDSTEVTNRAPSDRMARNVARVMAGALTVGGSVASSAAGVATANAAARQQASTYLGMLSGRGSDAYFGTSSPAAGLVGRTSAAAPKRAVSNALGELAQMATGDVMRADNPVPIGVRRQVVANIRSSESASRAVESGRGVVQAKKSVLSALVDQGYAPQAFLDRDASGVYLSIAEIEQGLASSTLPATGRSQLLAQLQTIPGAATMGIAPSTFGSAFAGFASSIGLLGTDGQVAGVASGAVESYTLRALADRGVVDARLADRAASGEFLTMADVETSFETSSLPTEARRRVIDAVKAASGVDGRIAAAALQSVVSLEMRSLAPRTTGAPFETRSSAPFGLGATLEGTRAPLGVPAMGLQALADRGIVPSRLAEMATSGDFLTMADIESGLADSTLAPVARQRVLDLMRSESGAEAKVHRRSVERALAGELAVAKAAGIARNISMGVAPFVPASAQAAALGADDTSSRAMSITPLGGVVALAERGVVPMALADRAMLGEFVSVAEIERALSDSGLNAEGRRRAMDVLGTSTPGITSDSTASRTNSKSTVTQAVKAVVPAATTQALGASAGRAWLEARASALLDAGASATALNENTNFTLGARGGAGAPLDLAMPEMALLARDSGDVMPQGGVGSRLADAMALSAAGPAGASRLVGTPVQTAMGNRDRADSAPPKGLGAALQPGERTARSQTSALGYVKGWNASSAASSEEMQRNLPVGLDRVLAPEVMLSGMRSLELNRVVREMSIRGAAGFESLGVLTTLADSGVDLGAGRTALGRAEARTGEADVSSLRAQRLLDRVQRAGGASASGALSDILLKGVDPVEAVSRARLSKRERAGLLSSILKGAERAETASIFEGAGGADFAFEWLARVDGSRSGVDVGAGEARAATARTFGAQRDSRVALSSPMGGANLVDSARRGRGDSSDGIAAHARPVASALTGSASRSDAIRRTDWRLVDTGAAATTSHADLGKLASALVGSSGSATSAMPMALVAPAAKSVAQSALRSPSSEQAKSSAPVQDKTAGAPAPAGPGGFSLNEDALDLLALEMAGLVADLMAQEEERTGRWQ